MSGSALGHHSTPAPAPAARLSRVSWRTVMGSVLLLALVLRLPGMWTDFWLDEIWSWTLVWSWGLTSNISGVWGIFTEIHQDNNNYLNTLYLYACGPRAPLFVYRLPPLIAGLATVWLGGQLAIRWTSNRSLSETTAWLAGAGLLATSQVAVVYSSEARGYALAGVAALAAQWTLGSLLKSGKWTTGLAYGGIASAGFLSHLSFLPVFLAQCLWASAALIWSVPKGTRLRRCGPLSVAFAIPSLVVGGLWLVDLSRTNVGGGPHLQAWLVACDTLSMPCGASLPESLSLPLAVMFAGLLIMGLGQLRRAANLEVISLASVLIIAPAVLYGLAPEGLVYPRHFLVSLTLLIPVAGIGLASCFQGEMRAVRLAGGVAVVAWCLGNGTELVRFWTNGRGQYQAALQHLLAESAGRTINVGSDFDFRNGMVLAFYMVRSPTPPTLQYVPQQMWGQYQLDRLIAHDQSRDADFARDVEVMGQTYVLDRVFPFAGPVGWHWATYRRRE